jgi:hypothetical protein
MEEIYLTQEEYKHALDIGYERSIKHRDKLGERGGSTFRTGRQLPDIVGDMLGAVAESAVAKHFGTHWNDKYWDLADHSKNKKAPDVEPYFEVRRINRIDGQLSLRSDDEPTKVAILAYVDFENSQKVILLGGIKIQDAFDCAIDASKANQSDCYLYFAKTDTYMVMQQGLENVSTFDPANALSEVN